jgi:glycosyltransferase involved in cell wall biosynthesis
VDPAVARVVTVGDVAAAVDALSEMLKASRAKRAELGAIARQEALRLFSVDVVAKRVSDALGELVAQTG